MSSIYPSPNADQRTVMTLKSLVTYLVNARYRLLGFGFVGLLLGLGIYYFCPKYYEASFILKMPTANGVSALGNIEKHIIKPVPPSLDAKKLLLRPEEFPVAVLSACGFTDNNEDRKRLVGSLVTYEVNYATAVQVVVRIAGRDKVEKCAQAILAYETEFTNTQKDRYVSYLIAANPKAQSSEQVLVNEPAQLTAAIRISDGIVSPRFWHLLLGCFFLALLLSCFIDWLRYQWRGALSKND